MNSSHLLADTIFTLALFGASYWYICIVLIIVMFYGVIKTKKMLLRIFFILFALVFAYIPLMQYLW
ncbi:hypothetical protein [Proteus vulgaris]|uniref:hypothetical protein n=1 Tax=Proteus vulgaris TaxID=585 RepID=UPI000E1B870F|nr:hypothetical protein [Proteus vulgaris]